MEIVLFATGSPILVDVEESLARASLRLRAGIRNRDGTDYLTAPTPLLRSTDLDPAILETPFLIPLFGSANRRLAAHEAKALGLDRPYSLIDPTAIVPRRLTFGPGSYVNAGCTLGAGSVFGAFVFVNRGTTIGHHAEIGDFVSIGPGVVVAGQTRLPFTSSVTVNDTGAEMTGASLTGVIVIVLAADEKRIPVPLDSAIVVVRAREAVLLAAGV